MKKVFTLLLLVGCGTKETNSFDSPECQTYTEGYSHTVMYCGGREVDNVEDVFITCNVRKSRDEQYDGCIGNTDIMDLDPNCELQHVCFSPWTELE